MTDVIVTAAQWGGVVLLFGLFIAVALFLTMLIIIPMMELAFRLLKKMGMNV